MLNLLKSPVGIGLVALTLVVSLSPESRMATRRIAVKGTALILELTKQVQMRIQN